MEKKKAQKHGSEERYCWVQTYAKKQIKDEARRFARPGNWKRWSFPRELGWRKKNRKCVCGKNDGRMRS